MRTLLIVIAAAIVFYLVFYGIRTLFLIRTSAELVKKSQSFERLIEGGSPRILIVGDSTGVGTGSVDPALSVAGRFGSAFPDAHIRNISVNGWKVKDALLHFPDEPGKRYDIILFQIGANDIIRGTPLREFSETLDTLFRKSSVTGKRVFALHSGNIGLAPLFPWPVSRILRSRTLTFRAEYRRIAAMHGVTYIDLYQEKENDPFYGKESEFYAADLLHLTGKGYGVWFEAIRKTMQDASL